MIYLHKLIPLLISPLFVVIILVLWGVYFNSKRAILLAFSILVFCSLPVFSNKLILNLEKDYALAPISSSKTAHAVVVLSGMVRTVEGTNGLRYELGDAADRIFAGIDLIKEKTTALSSILMKLGEKAYKENPENQNPNSTEENEKMDKKEDVVDADFEEVKPEDEKKNAS